MKAALAKPLALRSEVDPIVTTLPNGLRLLVQRVPTNPTVFIDGDRAHVAQLRSARARKGSAESRPR